MVILKLVRRGRRHLALYDIIAASKRAKCDGKCIEKLGTYNPMKEISDVVLYEDKIIKRLNDGAKMSSTVRSILSKAGVLFRWHIEQGVIKGKVKKEEKDKRILKIFNFRLDNILSFLLFSLYILLIFIFYIFLYFVVHIYSKCDVIFYVLKFSYVLYKLLYSISLKM